MFTVTSAPSFVNDALPITVALLVIVGAVVASGVGRMAHEAFLIVAHLVRVVIAAAVTSVLVLGVVFAVGYLAARTP